MRYRTRGWIMLEADIVTMLRLIDEKIRSPEIDVGHCDALIRLRNILEDDLNADRISRPSIKPADDQEKAA
jgi:hypothetical protein